MSDPRTAITMDMEDFVEDHEEGIGVCKACGETQHGCEPDACNYECDNCGERQVFGLDQALLEGWLKLV